MARVLWISMNAPIPWTRRNFEEYLEGNAWRPEVGELVNRQTGRRVAAVIPVHLYGQPANMDPIQEMAERYHLTVIEDACQAHGAEYYFAQERALEEGRLNGQRRRRLVFTPARTWAHAGKAGAVTTNDAEIARKIRMLRDHGPG